MHTDVILTNKRRTHAESNYTNTKLKAWFRRLLQLPARKRSGPIPHPRTVPTWGQGQYTDLCTMSCVSIASRLVICSSAVQQFS